MIHKISRFLCSCSTKVSTQLTFGRQLSTSRYGLSSNPHTFVSGVEGRPLHFDAQATILPLFKLIDGHPHSKPHAYGWDTTRQEAGHSPHYPSTSLFSPLHSPLQRIPVGVPINYRTVPITYSEIPRDKPMEDPLNNNNIVIEDAPDPANRIEKRAARLVIIRRRKMNRHKLKKLRKKMKIIFAKLRLRRRLKLEKTYLNEKLAQIREAEKFDAKEHVAMLIAKAKEIPLPLRYNGKRMPVWFIKQMVAEGKIVLKRND